jgi:prepilin-type N-terminal cleavage/methylation domain-containing protein/prepilin-type processing-associated H-X9-DG protein
MKEDQPRFVSRARPCQSRRIKCGFTLIELLVVIGIIAVLIAILLPTLSSARASAKGVTCLSNLRQLAIAANAYTTNNAGLYPPAYWFESKPPLVYSYAWDFTSIRDTTAKTTTIKPGLLWQGDTNAQIQQCPSFDGRSNTPGDPYTGYNYNTSYVGHGQSETIPAPIRAVEIKNASRCALFGDGQYTAGANKFMRAPFPNPGDVDFTDRAAGTQGFRHRGKTNVAFADGHVESLGDRCVKTTPDQAARIAPDTGFLSDDNSLYSPG